MLDQYRALVSPTSDVLQVLAGPGTGKTRVITARVAYLLCVEHLAPEDIIVTTFTKKAANEMKRRLNEMLVDYSPKIQLNNLFIGTFHSICVRILRVFGSKIELDSRFKIADETDSKQLIKRVLQDKYSDAPGASTTLVVKVTDKDINEYKYFISACKSKALFPDEVPLDLTDKAFEDHIYTYKKYQHSLRTNNLIDFDDCLLLAYKLLKKYPTCLHDIKHVLVDEFQDTNLVQLELMYLFGLNSHNRVTVVGDPDQSIYGFRHAEANNFYRMENYYVERGAKVMKVQLDENYRSTSNILSFAETVIDSKQKSKREPKKLKSNTKKENLPVYFDAYVNNKEEARRIAEDVRTLDYKYSDIAILIRSAFLSRMIEQELIHANIPYIIVHGRSFWELREVKLMVDYLRAIASNVDWLGYSRSMEFVITGLGTKSLQSIENDFESRRGKGHAGNVYKIIKSIVKEDRKGFSTKAREGLRKYVKTIHKARHILKNESKEMPKRLNKMFDLVVEQSNLIELVCSKKSKAKSEEEARNDITENLNELKNQLITFAPAEQVLPEDTDKESERLSEESKDSSDILTQFLDSIYLYEQTHYKQSKENDNSEGKVTITTIHGAKGLEWPVVFIPGLADGIFPSKYVLNEPNSKKRNATMDEECRCLYVATTRAKERLYLSYFVEAESFWQDTEKRTVSSLIKGRPMKLVEKRKHSNYGRAVGFASANKKAADFEKFKSRNARMVVQAYKEFSHIPTAVPVVFTTAKKRISRITGLNPVTGAPLNKKVKRKRLGMGRPMKPYPLGK
ncbi:hypothetical protein FOA43_000250 [Brettanomyces nanus]|uniref:DNA 3'-5' helicase n=1 Tax=Eeniella nana TaxID=13502 RepID=A0A875RW37_EENNA|nr:uncharacterized protein FOA43_000250 [Brettanomyces nanus]QPG72946.1 hypothetical protein FOA43_000250 [Brettanomyces nanus]